MTLAQRLQQELRSAILERDELRRDTLRMATAAAYNVEKEARRPLTDDELIGVLSREVKTRRESIEAFRSAGRQELAQREEREVAVLAAFLPQQLDEEEIRRLVSQAITETGAGSARDLGRVMARLAPQTRGRADGKQVSGLVAQELARLDLAGHDHP
ncbi:MAG: GatB/YqeY domain-containing protein [Chloroflexi bacterium]|nr:GatB/YqeY domain-containing protein [Chloroflexota bacterium]